jgi:hypothetical protein
MEEGAVGGVMAEKSEAEKHTTIGKNIPSIDLTQMKKIQQEVLQWGIFEDLGKLDSSSRFYEASPLPQHLLPSLLVQVFL